MGYMERARWAITRPGGRFNRHFPIQILLAIQYKLYFYLSAERTTFSIVQQFGERYHLSPGVGMPKRPEGVASPRDAAIEWWQAHSESNIYAGAREDLPKPAAVRY